MIRNKITPLVLLLLCSSCVVGTDVKQEQDTHTAINDLQVACTNNTQSIEELKTENAKIKGELEKLSHIIEQREASEATLLNKKNIAEAEKEQSNKLEQTDSNITTVGQTPEKEGKDVDIEELYKLARKDHEQKNYVDAEKHYTAIIGTPASWYDERARFFLGKMYSESGQHKKAIIALQDFADRYPKSKNIANAVYAQAEEFIALDQKEEAKVFLKDVIQRFPKTKEAMLARKRLKSQ